MFDDSDNAPLLADDNALQTAYYKQQLARNLNNFRGWLDSERASILREALELVVYKEGFYQPRLESQIDSMEILTVNSKLTDFLLSDTKPYTPEWYNHKLSEMKLKTGEHKDSLAACQELIAKLHRSINQLIKEQYGDGQIDEMLEICFKKYENYKIQLKYVSEEFSKLAGFKITVLSTLPREKFFKQEFDRDLKKLQEENDFRPPTAPKPLRLSNRLATILDIKDKKNLGNPKRVVPPSDEPRHPPKAQNRRPQPKTQNRRPPMKHGKKQNASKTGKFNAKKNRPAARKR